MARKNLVVLISGHGRNLQALIDANADGRIPARIAAVISNRADAAGLDRARRAGIPAVVINHQDFASRDAFDAALADELDRHQPDIVALAGFMRVLGDAFIARYRGRLLNIHPSLLPKYPGLDTHRRALEAARGGGDAEHGASVHFVTEQLDGGPCIIQGKFTVTPQDDAQTMAERTMREIELKIYPQAIAWLARGELALTGQQVSFCGRTLAAPLTLRDLEGKFT